MVLRLDMTYLAVAAAVTLRFAIFAATLPLLDQRSVPLLWRLALAAVVGLAVTPVVAGAVDPVRVDLSWPSLAGEAARSLLIGALLSFAVAFVFAAVRFAGQVTGIQVGFAIVNTIDPQNGGQVSVISQLYYLLAVMMFFALDVHQVVLAALVRSCTVLPPFGPLAASAGAWELVRGYGALFGIGLQIAAPCVIVLLLISATMGVVVKTVPQLNVLVVGFPVKIAAGIATIGLSLAFFGDIFGSLLGGLEADLVRLLGALR